MSDAYLKLTAYFGERQRTGKRFVAEAMLDLFAERQVATSVMLRGIASFGLSRIVRSDQSLTLSEDPPVAIAAAITIPENPHTTCRFDMPCSVLDLAVSGRLRFRQLCGDGITVLQDAARHRKPH